MSEFTTDKITIYGFSKTGVDRKVQSSVPIVENVPACIQPGGTDILVLSIASINAAQAVVIYLENIDVNIKNGYKLVDQDGRQYIVHGVPEVWRDRFDGELSHQKIAAQREV